MYVVRAVRVHSYHAAIVLTTEIETWAKASDSKLERLVSYLNMTKEGGPTWEFYYCDGDLIEDVWFEEESDADHGSCLRTGRSFSGWLTTWRHGSYSNALVDFGRIGQKIAAISTAHSEPGAVKGSWTKSSAWEACTGAYCRWQGLGSNALRERSILGIF